MLEIKSNNLWNWSINVKLTLMYGSERIDDLWLSRKRGWWRWNRRCKHTAMNNNNKWNLNNKFPSFYLKQEVLFKKMFNVQLKTFRYGIQETFCYFIQITFQCMFLVRPIRWLYFSTNNFQLMFMPHVAAFYMEVSATAREMFMTKMSCFTRFETVETDLWDGSGCAGGCNGWCTLMCGGVGRLPGWCTPRLGGVPDIGCARPPCNDWGDGVIRELK